MAGSDRRVAAQRARMAGRFESITVYQRGWRLGGKGASSRGDNGRIEEHGLHVWLGSYENAFTLMRECYAELDRPTTDPTAPIQTWRPGVHPRQRSRREDRWKASGSSGWADSPATTSSPVNLTLQPAVSTSVHFVQRGLQLIVDFSDSLQAMGESGLTLSASAEMPSHEKNSRYGASAVEAVSAHAHRPTREQRGTARPDRLARWKQSADTLDYETRADHRLSWILLSLVTATTRGVMADGLITDPRGFRAINDEDYGDWVIRHGAHPDVLEFPVLRAMYNMVFGYEKGHLERPTVARRRRDAARRDDVLHLQGCDLLEDDRRHGRHRDGAHVRGTAPPRREIRVLPSPRRPAPRPEPTQHRVDHDGPPGTAGRRRRPLRPIDPGAPSARFPEQAAGRQIQAEGRASRSSSRISAPATTPRSGCFAAVSISTGSCSRYPLAWCRSWPRN